MITAIEWVGKTLLLDARLAASIQRLYKDTRVCTLPLETKHASDRSTNFVYRYSGTTELKLDRKLAYLFYSASALLAMQTAVIAKADLSVCLSVRPSHPGVLSRRMKIRSCGLQYQIGKSFLFLER